MAKCSYCDRLFYAAGFAEWGIQSVGRDVSVGWSVLRAFGYSPIPRTMGQAVVACQRLEGICATYKGHTLDVRWVGGVLSMPKLWQTG